MHKKILSHFKKVDPVIHGLALLIDALVLSPSDTPYLKLVESIVSQQLSVKASDTIFMRLKKLFPKEVITPEKLVKLPEETLRSCGLSYQKIKYLKDLSVHVIEKKLSFDKYDKLTEEKIIEELTQVKGIGRWTAEMFLMFHLGREDVFSLGDLGLRRSIEKHYFNGKKATDKQIMKISKKWSPYRTYASMILWRSLG